MEAGVNEKLASRLPVRPRLIRLIRKALRDRYSLAMHVAKHPRPPPDLVRKFRRSDVRVDGLISLCGRHLVAAYTDREVCLLMTEGELKRLEASLGPERDD
jgi:hypothetical protein